MNLSFGQICTSQNPRGNTGSQFTDSLTVFGLASFNSNAVSSAKSLVSNLDVFARSVTADMAMSRISSKHCYSMMSQLQLSVGY